MKRTAAKIFTLNDARDRAAKILPRTVFNLLDGGSCDEITMRENRRAWDEVVLRPRAAAVPDSVDLSTTVLGEDLKFPLVLAPIGGLRLLCPDADRAAMRAANAAGTASILSTMSATPLEEVAAAATGPAWFQLYFRGGRDGAESLVERAQQAGFTSLFVTLDISGGILERIVRDNGRIARLKGEAAVDSSLPSTLSLLNAIRFAPQLARHLRWTADYVRDGVPRKFAQQDEDLLAKAAAENAPVPTGGKKRKVTPPTWDDMVWIREAWKGKLVAKGLVRGDDARRAVDLGVDGIVVSNHGGRQLDTGIATLRALPEVRAAVGDDIQVLIDGGVRRGTDIVKALALGANAVVAGRPYAYGLAAAGEAGVAKILNIFQMELRQTMEALGLSSLKEIDESSIDTAQFFLAARMAAQYGAR